MANVPTMSHQLCLPGAAVVDIQYCEIVKLLVLKMVIVLQMLSLWNIATIFFIHRARDRRKIFYFNHINKSYQQLVRLYRRGAKRFKVLESQLFNLSFSHTSNVSFSIKASSACVACILARSTHPKRNAVIAQPTAGLHISR